MRKFGQSTRLVFFTLFLLGTTSAQTDSKLNIAVIDLETQGGLSPQEAAILTNRLRSSLVATNVFNVLDRGLMDEILTEADIPHALTGLPPILGLFLGANKEPKDFRDYCDGDDELYEALALELIERGVQPDSDGREPWFLSHAHDQKVIDDTLDIFNESVKAVKAK